MRKPAASRSAIKRSAAGQPAVRRTAGRKRAATKPPAKKTAAARARPRRAGSPGAGSPGSAKRGHAAHGGAHKPPVNPPFPAYAGGLPYLFVSYAHQDMRSVFGVIRKLYDSRYRIWYDEGIEPGNEWPEVVGKAIVNCGQFLVFMSPHASRSRNVRNEINLAFTENKDILVAYLKSAKLTEGMKLQIGTVQSISRLDAPEREFVEKLKKVIGSSVR